VKTLLKTIDSLRHTPSVVAILILAFSSFWYSSVRAQETTPVKNAFEQQREIGRAFRHARERLKEGFNIEIGTIMIEATDVIRFYERLQDSEALRAALAQNYPKVWILLGEKNYLSQEGIYIRHDAPTEEIVEFLRCGEYPCPE
jgi:hypothetical protein